MGTVGRFRAHRIRAEFGLYGPAATLIFPFYKLRGAFHAASLKFLSKPQLTTQRADKNILSERFVSGAQFVLWAQCPDHRPMKNLAGTQHT